MQGLNYLSVSVQKRAKSPSDVEQLLEEMQKGMQRLQGGHGELQGQSLTRAYHISGTVPVQVVYVLQGVECSGVGSEPEPPLCLKPTTVTASPQKAKKNAQTNVFMQMQGVWGVPQLSCSAPSNLERLTLQSLTQPCPACQQGMVPCRQCHDSRVYPGSIMP